MPPEIPFNWTALGTGLAVAFIAFMQVWQTWQAKQVAQKAEAARVVLTEKLATTAKTVDEVHVLVNGSMALVKKTLAETTAAKSVITKDPEDMAAAKVAMADYLDHVAKLAKVENSRT